MNTNCLISVAAVSTPWKNFTGDDLAPYVKDKSNLVSFATKRGRGHKMPKSPENKRYPGSPKNWTPIVRGWVEAITHDHERVKIVDDSGSGWVDVADLLFIIDEL